MTSVTSPPFFADRFVFFSENGTQKIFAFNNVPLCNNPEYCSHALCLHLSYSSLSAILTLQSTSHLESAIIIDMGTNIWFCSPSHNDFHFFFYPILTHSLFLSSHAFTATHAGICKRACVVHSICAVHAGRNCQIERP